jgi:hypothetical protein
MHVADIIIETYAMESSWLRSQKVSGASELMTAVLLRDAMARIEISARNALAAANPAAINEVRSLAAYEPIDAIEIRRKIAHRLLETERYLV